MVAHPLPRSPRRCPRRCPGVSPAGAISAAFVLGLGALGACFPADLPNQFYELTASLESSSTGSTGDDGTTTSTVTGTVTGVTSGPPDGSSTGGPGGDGWTSGDSEAPPPALGEFTIDACASDCALLGPREVEFVAAVAEGGEASYVTLTVEGHVLALLDPPGAAASRFEHHHLITSAYDLVPEPMGKKFTIEARAHNAEGEAGPARTVDLQLLLPAGGSTVWTSHGGRGVALAAAVADDGGVIAVGRQGTLPTTQIAIRKYHSETGNELWSRRIPAEPGQSHGVNAAHGIVVTSGGDFYVVGQRVVLPGDAPRLWISRWDPEGSPLGDYIDTKAGSSARAIVLREDPVWMESQLLVVGETTGQGLTSRAFVQALRPNFFPHWRVDHDPGDPLMSSTFTSLAEAADGSLAVGGATWEFGGDSRLPLVGRYDATGDLLWIDTPLGQGTIDGVVATANNEVIAIGERKYTNNNPSILRLLRYGAEGALEDDELVAGRVCGDDGCSLALDPVGRLLLGGSLEGLNTEIYVQKGEPVPWNAVHWTKSFAGEWIGGGYCHGLAAGPQGQVYAVGYATEEFLPAWWVGKINP